ncbi:Arylsulfatase [Planctomycetes bacterium Pan216]|uniref:Arylsulfatase n=1 Tax=Kolteria novifilia TaxID=2527975 RepID=A0A518B3C3_9BACT|nr:Arylsulfatase [Planctomycetes bacterium Pan216]
MVGRYSHGTLWACLAFFCSGHSLLADEPPNIVLILADDLTYDDLGCEGNPDVQTPNIDRLATQGKRFTHCFTATAMCAPTRQQLYTGIWPVRNGAYPNHSKVKPGTKSIVHHLQTLGYRVGIHGKTHFGPPRSFPFEKVTSIDDFINDGDRPYCLVVASNDPHVPWRKATDVDPATLTLPPYLVDTPQTRQAWANYQADIKALDDEVGKIVDTVDRSASADNTLVIFTSEQGAQFPSGKWTCYENGLRTAFIVRWPGQVKPDTVSNAMIRYVDVVPTLVEIAGGDPKSIDTGRDGAPDGGRGFDGSSFLPVLLGKRHSHARYTYGVHTTEGIIAGKPYPIRSIRNRRFKYIANLMPDETFQNTLIAHDGSGYWKSWVEAAKTDPKAAKLVQRYLKRPAVEFYDLCVDPHELDNLADRPEYSSRKDEMRGLLNAWMEQQGDRGVETELAAKKAQRRGRRKKAKARGNMKSDRPNIVLIMADDMGFSDIGCYGGEIETPTLDRLAREGLRFTQFYNTGRCCPTRASLLTGLHPHQTGIGHMTNDPRGPKSNDRGLPGYRGFLNRRCVTLAEALKSADYHTLMAGKWHVGYHGQEKWPLARGFDRFYGILSGASNYFQPLPPRGLTLGNEPVLPEGDYYTTDAFTDYAIDFVNEASSADDRPFFLYLAYTCPHWPLHARPEDIAKYRGKYKLGWDKLREQRHHRLKDLGIVNKEWALAPRDARAWDNLDAAKQDEMDERMAIYAAQVDRMDQNIGRLVGALEQLGELDNTLLLFLVDNGGCAEGGELGGAPRGDLNNREKYGVISYGQAWANASNTPFRRYKHYVHEGGISTPLIAHWPNGIAEKGSLRHQPAYLPDIMPTLVDVSGASYPTTFRGHEIEPMEGMSLLAAFANEPLEREAMYWEHEGNRAIRTGDWKLVSARRNRIMGGPWELYDLASDRTEENDLSGEHPDRVKRMAQLWTEWAQRCQVLPQRPTKSEAKRVRTTSRTSPSF